ncbi:EAL domain-containing protein [Herbaspirillum sp. NPDC087042]|uniref:EAL domain-containing protein n=1 Tax=Herbaspirillum sp. NPDC087042 TaxID=3364004 RepID=UPI0038189FE0
MSHKNKVVALVIVATVMAAIGPVLVMMMLSRQAVLRAEHERLAFHAGSVIDRAEHTFAESRTALKVLSPLMLRPCSPEHIEQMRLIIVSSRIIDEMGYYEYGQLRCTAWGLVRPGQAPRQARAEFLSSDGVEVALDQSSFVADGPRMMSMQYGAHNVLVHPDRFIDIVPGDGVHLVLARTRGHRIAESGAVLPVEAIARASASAQDVDGYLVETVSRNGWTALAMSDNTRILREMEQQQRWFLPAGALVGLVMVLLVLKVSQARLSPLAELQLAVKKKEFIVHYQPIMEIASGRCIGAEALVRWKRPDGSVVRPDLFIPLAEESGLILPLTDQVVARVVKEMRALLCADRNLHIAINVAPQDIKTGRILEVVSRHLAGSGIRTEQIWMEATERGCMDITSARLTLARAREMGHSMALDDFGTGYSNLQYLQGLPMDALKIDKSFVSTIGTGAATSAVIDHIIAMAKSLELYIVAEGVETPEQAAYLSSHGVDFAQGWLFAKPMPVDEFIDFYRVALDCHGDGPQFAAGFHWYVEAASAVGLDD